MKSEKEIIEFLENRELDFISDIDNIRFFIEGLKKEGFEYIRKYNKEYKENEEENNV